MKKNIDSNTVEGFGDEWIRFDQSEFPVEESHRIFNGYFSIFPWSTLPQNSVGFDLGCGSGRWAKWVAPQVGTLHCIDPSDAIDVARSNLSEYNNCHFYKAGVDDMPLEPNSMDFGYSLGVLHHIPDTQAALSSCVQKLKPGAPFLVYLYYAFDNKPSWFRIVWRMSDSFRKIISRMPFRLRYITTQFLAMFLYWPLARFSKLLEKLGMDVTNIPLSAYRKRSFYTMRTDALDRFGTQLEHRFTKLEIQTMMETAGLKDVRFKEDNYFWCALGLKKVS